MVHREAWPHAQEFFGILSTLVCIALIAPTIIFCTLLGRDNFFREMALAETPLGCQGQNSDTRISKRPVPVALLNYFDADCASPM